jgi:hypothetical protein
MTPEPQRLRPWLPDALCRSGHARLVNSPRPRREEGRRCNGTRVGTMTHPPASQCHFAAPDAASGRPNATGPVTETLVETHVTAAHIHNSTIRTHQPRVISHEKPGRLFASPACTIGDAPPERTILPLAPMVGTDTLRVHPQDVRLAWSANGGGLCSRCWPTVDHPGLGSVRLFIARIRRGARSSLGARIPRGVHGFCGGARIHRWCTDVPVVHGCSRGARGVTVQGYVGDLAGSLRKGRCG